MSSARIRWRFVLHAWCIVVLLACLLQGCAYKAMPLRYPWSDVLTAALREGRFRDPQAVLVSVHIASYHEGSFAPPFSYFFDFAKEDNMVLELTFDESAFHPAMRSVGTEGTVDNSDRVATPDERAQVRAVWSQAIIPPETVVLTASKQLPSDFDRQTALITLMLLSGPPVQKAEHAPLVWKAFYTSQESTCQVVMNAITGAVIRTAC